MNNRRKFRKEELNYLCEIAAFEVRVAFLAAPCTYVGLICILHGDTTGECQRCHRQCKTYSWYHIKTVIAVFDMHNLRFIYLFYLFIIWGPHLFGINIPTSSWTSTLSLSFTITFFSACHLTIFILAYFLIIISHIFTDSLKLPCSAKPLTGSKSVVNCWSHWAAVIDSWTFSRISGAKLATRLSSELSLCAYYDMPDAIPMAGAPYQ